FPSHLVPAAICSAYSAAPGTVPTYAHHPSLPAVPWMSTTPLSPLFPYTTLFRSPLAIGLEVAEAAVFAKIEVETAHALALLQGRSEEHTSELQSRENLVCRLLPEKKKLVSGKSVVSCRVGWVRAGSAPAQRTPAS